MKRILLMDRHKFFTRKELTSSKPNRKTIYFSFVHFIILYSKAILENENDVENLNAAQ